MSHTLELVEALRDVLRVFATRGFELGSPQEQAVTKAVNAIRKAEGKPPL